MSNKFFKRVHPLSILTALAMASTQGCAVAAEEVDCEVLQGTGINQFELQFVHGDEAAHAGLELCVIAENYDACDKLDGTADENVFVVNYEAAVTNVRSLRIQERVGVVIADGADEVLQLEVVAVSRGDRALVVRVAAGSYPVEIAAEAKPGRFGTEGGTEIASCQ